MHTSSVTVADRRRYADKTTVRWRVMVATALIGVAAALVVRVWGDPRTRADETSVLIVTVLVVGIAPLVEWIFRFAFARVSTLSDRLAAANAEIDRLTLEAALLRGALQIENFAAEAEELGSLAAPFWERLERAFEQYSVGHLRAKAGSLQEIVEAADWPDRAPPRAEPTSLGDLLPMFASCIYPQYGFELIPRDSFPAFDALRRNVRRRVRQWGERLKTDQHEELTVWMRTFVGPTHANTLKLAWHLEVANATRTGKDAAADYGYYRAVRDTLEAT